MNEVQLYQRRCVRREELPLPSVQLQALPPEELLLALLYGFGGEISENPSVLRCDTHGENSLKLQIFFRHSIILCGDFLVRYGELMALISQHFPLLLLGTTPEQETGELSATLGSKEIVTQKRNVSGRGFDVLYGVCFELELQDSVEADFLAEAVAALDYRFPAIVLPKAMETVAIKLNCYRDTFGSFFCYLALEPEATETDLLQRLDLNQKLQLWQLFMSQRITPREFDWLFNSYCAGEILPLLEWEISLRLVLEQSGVTVVNHPGEFKVLDSAGNALPFDFIHGYSGEKIFLKLLFPVLPQAAKSN